MLGYAEKENARPRAAESKHAGLTSIGILKERVKQLKSKNYYGDSIKRRSPLVELNNSSNSLRRREGTPYKVKSSLPKEPSSYSRSSPVSCEEVAKRHVQPEEAHRILVKKEEESSRALNEQGTRLVIEPWRHFSPAVQVLGVQSNAELQPGAAFPERHSKEDGSNPLHKQVHRHINEPWRYLSPGLQLLGPEASAEQPYGEARHVLNEKELGALYQHMPRQSVNEPWMHSSLAGLTVETKENVLLTMKERTDLGSAKGFRSAQLVPNYAAGHPPVPGSPGEILHKWDGIPRYVELTTAATGPSQSSTQVTDPSHFSNQTGRSSSGSSATGSIRGEDISIDDHLDFHERNTEPTPMAVDLVAGYKERADGKVSTKIKSRKRFNLLGPARRVARDYDQGDDSLSSKDSPCGPEETQGSSMGSVTTAADKEIAKICTLSIPRSGLSPAVTLKDADEVDSGQSPSLRTTEIEGMPHSLPSKEDTFHNLEALSQELTDQMAIQKGGSVDDLSSSLGSLTISDKSEQSRVPTPAKSATQHCSSSSPAGLPPVSPEQPKEAVEHNVEPGTKESSMSALVPKSGMDVEVNTALNTHKRKISENANFVWVKDQRYQKLGRIGSGGSSEVYKVIAADCNIYALKKINLKGKDHGTALGFYTEIEYLERLRGKRNIIQLIDFEVTNMAVLEESYEREKIAEEACIYMVLECGEIDLAHILSKKRKEMMESNQELDINWLRFYWEHMLKAVKTIHEERIVHADLKPANFLLVRGELKLIDFGIAKAIQNDTTHIVRDSQVGTLNYMSPEAFMTNSKDEEGRLIKCGRASDIWSLGCILYQMVYGHTPFSKVDSFYAKIQAITSRKYEVDYLPLSCPWLLDTMKKCLTWDRFKRPSISELLEHPFLHPGLK